MGMRNRKVEPDSPQSMSIFALGLPPAIRTVFPKTENSAPKAVTPFKVASMSAEKLTFPTRLSPFASAAQRRYRCAMLFEEGTATCPISFPGIRIRFMLPPYSPQAQRENSDFSMEWRKLSPIFRQRTTVSVPPFPFLS